MAAGNYPVSGSDLINLVKNKRPHRPLDVHHVSTFRPVQPFFYFFRTLQNWLNQLFRYFPDASEPFYGRFRYLSGRVRIFFIGVSAIYPDASEPAVSVLSGIIQTLQNSLRNRVRIDACQAAEFFGGSVFDEGIRNRNIQKRS